MADQIAGIIVVRIACSRAIDRAAARVVAWEVALAEL